MRSPKRGAPDDVVDVMVSSSCPKVGGLTSLVTGMFVMIGRELGVFDRQLWWVTTGDVDGLRCAAGGNPESALLPWPGVLRR